MPRPTDGWFAHNGRVQPGGEERTNGRPDRNPKNRAVILLWISLVLMAVGSVGACLIQTDGGKIEVVSLKIPTENGQWITADLFRPKTATEENPAPMVVVCPGFERSKETMGSYSIELARRGIVVITIDPYGQGASSSTHQKRTASLEGYGVVPMVEYVHDTPNLNYIDKSRIGAAGYSAGGNAVLQSASRFGARQARALKHPKAAAQNKIASIFVGGYVLTLTDDVLATVDANVGMDYAYYDEGAYRTEKGNAHMHEAPEALRLVNSILPEDKKISEVEIGKIYGDYTNRTMRVVHNTRNIHPLMPYDTVHVASMINFFTTVFNLNPSILPSNQIWPIKELFTLTALAGAFLFLVPFATLMLRLPAFNSLAHPVPQALPAPGKHGKIILWITFLFSASMACFLFIPMARATTVLFPEASAGKQTWWFPERINNAILLWAVANGIIGLGIFFLAYKLHGKKRGVTPDMWGLKTNVKELAKTFCLALSIFAAFYGLLFASYCIFHIDFRFIFVSAAASFPPKMLLVALEYLPLFFIFYLANSIRVNCASRFDGQKEWVSMLINAVGNSVGLVMILAIQYIHLATTGTVYWTQEWLYANLLLGVIPLMFILPYFHRYFFRITGKVYLGPMVTCLIFIMIMLTGNVCYIPLK
jgi:dienelactone hydrolase